MPPQHIDNAVLGAAVGAFTLLVLLSTLLICAYDAYLAAKLETRVVERTAALDQTSAQLRLLLGRLADAQDEERRRLAAELHDIVDLPDIALLATTKPLEASPLRLALERTFEYRATHLLPSSLPEPSAEWASPYREMARENELVWTTLDELSTAVKGFLDPILAGERGVCSPTGWVWK